MTDIELGTALKNGHIGVAEMSVVQHLMRNRVGIAQDGLFTLHAEQRAGEPMKVDILKATFGHSGATTTVLVDSPELLLRVTG